MKRSPLASLVLFSLGIALFGAGCAPASTSVPTAAPAMNPAEAGAPLPTEFPYTVAEAEALAGFDVLEPAYLPAGVSFDHAAYQDAPHPHVTLYFKLVHETFGDLGTSFQITQAPQAEAVPDPNACGPAGMSVSSCGPAAWRCATASPPRPNPCCGRPATSPSTC